MNYIREINAFYAHLSTNEVSSRAILVWNALMQISNRNMWRTHLNIPMTALMNLTSLSRSSVYRALDELMALDRVQIKSRRGNRSAHYILLPFYPQAAP